MISSKTSIQLNVLIVDDSPIMRKMVRRALDMANLPLGSVLEANEGREALARLSEHEIDIVLADINMPVMNGVELVQRMVADGLLPRIPVVIVSTERSQERISQLKSLGVRNYLHKPFRPEAMRAAVADALEMEVPHGA
jgi:two-component system chemotaxis response regulator CheY